MDVITINTIIQFTKIFVGFFISVLIPGYLLSFVFFPNRTINDTTYRLGIGFGIAFIFLIFIGSILMLSFGFLSPWMLGIFLFFSSVVIFTKLRLLNKEKMFSLQSLWKTIKQFFVLLFLVAIGIYIGSYITTHSTQNKPEDFFSELYLLDSTRALANTFTIDGAYTQPLVIGVTSHEQSPTNFSLVIKTENSMLRIVGPFTVQPGERWEHQITFSSEELPTIYLSQRIIFKLYKDSNFYRIVFLTVKKLNSNPTIFSRNN